MARLFLSDEWFLPALGLNKTFDAGLMKIAIDDWEDQNWPHADMGSSVDVELGQWVMAVDIPADFRRTVIR